MATSNRTNAKTRPRSRGRARSAGARRYSYIRITFAKQDSAIAVTEKTFRRMVRLSGLSASQLVHLAIAKFYYRLKAAQEHVPGSKQVPDTESGDPAQRATQLLGLPADRSEDISSARRHRTARRAAPISTLPIFVANTGFRKQSLARALGLSARVLIRHCQIPKHPGVGQTRKGRLGKVASIRLYRLAALVVSAERVIGDSVNAATWLDKSSYGLGGLRPIDLVVSEFGVRMVEDELVRIEHGMLA